MEEVKLDYQPTHYTKCKIQPITFCRENNLDFLTGNVIKYICRHKDKNGLKDIEKAYIYFLHLTYKNYGKEGLNSILNIKLPTEFLNND